MIDVCKWSKTKSFMLTVWLVACLFVPRRLHPHQSPARLVKRAVVPVPRPVRWDNDGTKMTVVRSVVNRYVWVRAKRGAVPNFRGVVVRSVNVIARPKRKPGPRRRPSGIPCNFPSMYSILLHMKLVCNRLFKFSCFCAYNFCPPVGHCR